MTACSFSGKGLGEFGEEDGHRQCVGPGQDKAEGLTGFGRYGAEDVGPFEAPVATAWWALALFSTSDDKAAPSVQRGLRPGTTIEWSCRDGRRRRRSARPRALFLKLGLGFGIGLRMNRSRLLMGEAKALKHAPHARCREPLAKTGLGKIAEISERPGTCPVTGRIGCLENFGQQNRLLAIAELLRIVPLGMIVEDA